MGSRPRAASRRSSAAMPSLRARLSRGIRPRAARERRRSRRRRRRQGARRVPGDAGHRPHAVRRFPRRAGARRRGRGGALPAGAQRGLALFVGSGNCTVCHGGPRFSNGEFHDIGIPFFASPGRVDPGRHEGIRQAAGEPLQPARPVTTTIPRAAPRPARATSRSSIATSANSRCRRCATSRARRPYMHDGSLATLRDVVRHYSQLDEDRLHADGERILQAARPDEVRRRRPGGVPGKPERIAADDRARDHGALIAPQAA